MALAAPETLSTLTLEAKTYYDKVLLQRALPHLVHAQWGQKRNIPARGGKSIEFRKFSSLTAATTALTEGTPPSGTNLAMTSATATVGQYGDYIRGSDLIETQAIDNVLAETSAVLGEQMGNTLDVIDRAVLIAGTNVIYHTSAISDTTATTTTNGGGYGSGCLLDAETIRRAVRTLKRVNIKTVVAGKYIAIIHPDTWADLMGDADIADAFQHARERATGNPLFTGELGDYMGVRFVESTNAQLWASLGLSGSDAYATLFIGQGAYGVTELDALAAQTFFTPRGGDHSDPLAQVWIHGWKAAHVAVILDQNAILRVEHVTTRKEAA